MKKEEARSRKKLMLIDTFIQYPLMKEQARINANCDLKRTKCILVQLFSAENVRKKYQEMTSANLCFLQKFVI